MLLISLICPKPLTNVISRWLKPAFISLIKPPIFEHELHEFHRFNYPLELARSFPRSALPLRSSKNYVRPFPLARLPVAFPVAFRNEMEKEIRKSDSSFARFRNEMEKEIRKS